MRCHARPAPTQEIDMVCIILHFPMRLLWRTSARGGTVHVLHAKLFVRSPAFTSRVAKRRDGSCGWRGRMCRPSRRSGAPSDLQCVYHVHSLNVLTADGPKIANRCLCSSETTANAFRVKDSIFVICVPHLLLKVR